MQFLKSSVNLPVHFISAGQFISDIPWMHSCRAVNRFEIIIGVNETLYMQQDETQFEVNPSDVLLLLPNRIHKGYSMCNKNISFYWIHFYCPEEYQMIDASSLKKEISMLQAASGSQVSTIFIPVFSSPPNKERVNILCNQLLHVANSNYYTKQAADYLLTSLLIELSEQTITNFLVENEKKKSDKSLAKIVEWIRINITREITVTDIANEFNYNRDYLSRFFKRKTGVNLQEYIHIVKLSAAKDLLSRTSQDIKEIAYAIGFKDEKYFMKLFKRYERITPSEFRKAYFETYMNNS